MGIVVKTATENVQRAPYPAELAELVELVSYREGWQVILRDEVRDPADTHGVESAGLTLSIITRTVNSYPPHEPMRVRHLFAVPPATYNRESWQRWLFERFLDVERHECMEFFTIGEVKPYAPNHGPGWDPYLLTTVEATPVDRATSFRGEVNAQRVRLCNDEGMVSDTPVEPGSHGSEFDPELTYLRLANNLRAHTGHPPVEAFHCTGSMHAAGMLFHCTSPAHDFPPAQAGLHPPSVILDPPRPANYHPFA